MENIPKNVKDKLKLVFKVIMLKKLHKPRIPIEIFEKEEHWARPELAKLYEDTVKLVKIVVKNTLPFVEKIIEGYKVGFPKKIVLMSSFEYLGEIEPALEPISEEYEDSYGLYSTASQTIYLNMTGFFRFRNIVRHTLNGLVNWGKIKQEEVEEATICVTELKVIETLVHEDLHHIYFLKCSPAKNWFMEEWDVDVFESLYTPAVLYAYLDCNDDQFKKYMNYESLVENGRPIPRKDLRGLLAMAQEMLKRILAGDVEDICQLSA